MAKQLTKDQLKAIFAKKKFNKLPDELHDDLLDLADISGTINEVDEREWNTSTRKQREGILDVFSVEELRKFKMEKMKK